MNDELKEALGIVTDLTDEILLENTYLKRQLSVAEAKIAEYRLAHSGTVYALGQALQGKSAKQNRKKLSRMDVAHIRGLSRAGHSQRQIAKQYDINPATVSRVVRGIYHKESV